MYVICVFVCVHCNSQYFEKNIKDKCLADNIVNASLCGWQDDGLYLVKNYRYRSPLKNQHNFFSLHGGPFCYFPLYEGLLATIFLLIGGLCWVCLPHTKISAGAHAPTERMRTLHQNSPPPTTR